LCRPFKHTRLPRSAMRRQLPVYGMFGQRGSVAPRVGLLPSWSSHSAESSVRFGRQNSQFALADVHRQRASCAPDACPETEPRMDWRQHASEPSGLQRTWNICTDVLVNLRPDGAGGSAEHGLRTALNYCFVLPEGHNEGRASGWLAQAIAQAMGGDAD